MLIFSYMLCGAQATSLTVDIQTPGWLSSKINYVDQQTVENLTITGYINQADLSFIGTLMEKHNLNGHLDLESAVVVDTDYANATTDMDIKMFQLSKNVNLRRLSLPLSLPRISPFLLAHVKADTLDYGSERCNILTAFRSANVYSATNISPKVLILRDGVTKIETFSNGLTSRNLHTIMLPQALDSIGERAFTGCEDLTSVNLPDAIHTIGKYAFANTSYKPDTLHLPTHLKVFHTSSFPQNPGQVIVIPNSTEEFDNRHSAGSNISTGIDESKTYTLIINRVQPPKFVSNYSPRYVDLSSCILYVPKEGIEQYRNLKYDSARYGEGGNPYSYATIYPIPVPLESVMLNYTSYNLNVGNTVQLSVIAQPQNADNKRVYWKSSNPDIATVNWGGIVTAKSSGKAIITAVSIENPEISADCEITVRQPLESISLNLNNISLKVGEIFENLTVSFFPATSDNTEVIWRSSDMTIAEVDVSGKITANSPGTAIISVVSDENQEIKDECTVIVTQPVTGIELSNAVLELTEDESVRLTASVLPENATNKSVNWTSSDISIAMVSSNGTVYGIKPGQATIMASTVDGDFVALCKVIVTAKPIMVENIVLTPSSFNGKTGDSFKISATVQPETASNKGIIWSSSNSDIVTVDNGSVRLISEGNATVSAKACDGSGVEAICTIKVQDNSGVESIIIEKDSIVRIYTITGNLIYEGAIEAVQLSPGVYLIACGDKVIKFQLTSKTEF